MSPADSGDFNASHKVFRQRKLFVDKTRHLRPGLDRAVESYNKAVGSLESRVMVSARKFAELGAPVSEEIPEVPQIETTTRTLALEWDDEPALELLREQKPTGTEG